MKIYFLLLLMILFNSPTLFSQFPPHNNEESKVPAYTLPDPLVSSKGKRITSVREWENKQRPYILQLFKDNVYGQMPGKPRGLHFKTIAVDSSALSGKAVKKEIIIYFAESDSAPHMNVLLYLPKKNYPVAVFAGLNFLGNDTINSDTSSWPIEQIISNGYGVATAHYEDLEKDNREGWKHGIRSSLKNELKTDPASWGAISVWAWGLSRMQDYLETDPQVNSKGTIVFGHSRLGKTALWAAANDKRFSKVISNNSGEGGAALSKRVFGETTRDMNTNFPHWCIDRYKKYNDHPEMLPLDQHMLLSLIAPRPLYVASAEKDTWADPKGEFLSAKNAEPVYSIYQLKGLGVNEMPAIDHPVGNTIHYHIRTGEHAITEYDWKQYIEFADSFK
jgi:hypothetical protein